MKKLSPMDIGWLAGIIEGEGTMGISGYSYRLSVGMTDEDIVNRCLNMTGVGSIHTRQVPGYKKVYNWTVSSPNDIMHIFTSITSHYGGTSKDKNLKYG